MLFWKELGQHQASAGPALGQYRASAGPTSGQPWANAGRSWATPSWHLDWPRHPTHRSVLLTKLFAAYLQQHLPLFGIEIGLAPGQHFVLTQCWANVGQMLRNLTFPMGLQSEILRLQQDYKKIFRVDYITVWTWPIFSNWVSTPGDNKSHAEYGLVSLCQKLDENGVYMMWHGL